MIADKIVQGCECARVKNICGIDVSYRDNLAFSTAVVMNCTRFELLEMVDSMMPAKFPYIPGFFILREAGPVLYTMRLLKCDYDVLLLDGHGMLHPRKCGLASFIGVLINKPTIGVAKKLLCGEVMQDYFVKVNETICGFMHKNSSNKHVYISVGNRISLGDSIQLVKQSTRQGEIIPEPLRIADLHSKYICRRFFHDTSVKTARPN
jgi:deoxyinosine 3'endonuclease (endonuclease V)